MSELEERWRKVLDGKAEAERLVDELGYREEFDLLANVERLTPALLNRKMIACGPTAQVLTEQNLLTAFGKLHIVSTP